MGRRFECSYIYPREEDWVLARLVESGEKVLVAGVKSSGVSTLLKRLQKLSAVKLYYTRETGDALAACRHDYVVLDADRLQDALKVLSRCEKCIVGLTLPLLELASLPSKVAGVAILVPKPLSPSELYDYLSNVLGVKLEDWTLIDEIMWRTGGFPGPLCETVVKNNLHSTLITRSKLPLFGDMPNWLREAYSSDPVNLRNLAVHLLLAKFDEEAATSLGAPVKAPWLVRLSDGSIAIWPELLWLQPFLQKLFPREARKVFSYGLRRCRDTHSDNYLCFLYASSLYSITEARSHAIEALWYAKKAIREINDPIPRFRLVKRALELALEAYPREAGFWLREAIRAHKWLEPTPFDVGWLLASIRELVHSKQLGIEEVANIHVELGTVLATWGRIEELETTISELEELLRKTMWRAEASSIETAYLLLLATQAVVQGRWREADRILREVSPRLTSAPNLRSHFYRLALRALIALGRLGEARQLLGSREVQESLELQELEDFKAVLDILGLKSTREAQEYLERASPKTPIAKIATTILSTLYGRKTRSLVHPYWLNTYLLSLRLVGEGKVSEAYALIKTIEQEIPPLALVALDIAVATISPLKADRESLVEALSQLRDNISKTQLQGAIRVLDELIEAAKKGNEHGLRLALAKLVIYSLI